MSFDSVPWLIFKVSSCLPVNKSIFVLLFTVAVNKSTSKQYQNSWDGYKLEMHLHVCFLKASSIELLERTSLQLPRLGEII